jgi:hypothetical protein
VANNNAIRGMRNRQNVGKELLKNGWTLIDSIGVARLGKDHQLSSYPVLYNNLGVAPSPRLARFMDLHQFELRRATSHGPDPGMWIPPHPKALTWSSIVSLPGHSPS